MGMVLSASAARDRTIVPCLSALVPTGVCASLSFLPAAVGENVFLAPPGPLVYARGLFLYDGWVSVWLKKTVGIILIIAGLTALLTPLTPGSWLIFIGLELLGFTFWRRSKK